MHLQREISRETLHLLQQVYRSSRHHSVRQRAHFLMLFTQGFTLPQLAMILSVTGATLYNWAAAGLPWWSMWSECSESMAQPIKLILSRCLYGAENSQEIPVLTELLRALPGASGACVS